MYFCGPPNILKCIMIWPIIKNDYEKTKIYDLAHYKKTLDIPDIDNVHNVQDSVVDQAAADGAGNQGLPHIIPSNVSGIRFQILRWKTTHFFFKLTFLLPH